MKLFTLTFFIVFSAFADEEASAPAKDRVGPGKAVVAASAEDGVKLSEKGLRTLELKFSEVKSAEVSVPKSSLIHFQDFSAIYRERSGWFKMIEVEPIIKNGTAKISSKELKNGDRVVVENGGLLRVVELDIFGPEADACAD
ncbi:MAG: hypothetical protein K2Q26_12265 [Bdellovibrionales bacterium]|nr:hypothetical protein [Bdellovibrionales bacterium]